MHLQQIERRKYASPRMPVSCTDCRHAVPGLVTDLIHCVSGPVSEVRSRNFASLCRDYAPAARERATSASEAAARAPQAPPATNRGGKSSEEGTGGNGVMSLIPLNQGVLA